MNFECKEYELMISDYLMDNLKYKELSRFIDHIDNCSECREELSIQFLVTEGMNVLKGADSYNLQSCLDNKLSYSHRRLGRYKRFLHLYILVTILLVVAIVIVILVFLGVIPLGRL